MALADNLVSYWKLDEASGNAIDSYGSNTLTDHNAVGSATGKINTARDFEETSSQYLSITSNATLQMGDIDFTIAFWVKFESLGAYRMLLSKWSDSPDSREYMVYYDVSRTCVTAIISADGAALTFVDSNVAISTATWYFVVAGYDATGDALNININAGTTQSAAHSGGAFVGTNAFMLGAYSSGGVPALFHDGLIDEPMIWKRALSGAEIANLYNSGNGQANPFAALPKVLRRRMGS